MATQVFNIGDKLELIADEGRTFYRVTVHSCGLIDGSYVYGVNFSDHLERGRNQPYHKEKVVAEKLRPEPPEVNQEIRRNSVVDCWVHGAWRVGVVQAVIKKARKGTTYRVRNLGETNGAHTRSVVRISQKYQANREHAWVVARHPFN